MASLSLVLLSLLSCASCGRAPESTPVIEPGPSQEAIPTLTRATLGAGEKLRVVATTSIVGDVVHSVGGESIELQVLMPRGTDPHAFEPTPRDAATVADAHVLFVNGVGLEAFLGPLLQSAAEKVSVVPVSHGIGLLRAEAAEEHEGEFDPHVWLDPQNMVVWTHNIELTLSTLDPANADAYRASALAYEAQLQALDAWIEDQVAQLAQEKRKLVTGHTSFNYFAQRYGFEQVGAVFPGYSTLAEPSAQDIARLEDAIRQFKAQAVFVDLTVNPGLARRVANDTGTTLVFLYSGSLSESGGPADSYLALMRYNTSAIVGALR